MNAKPFKVDKNGTEYYYDWTCQRCGGQGGLDQWVYTGYTCFECGGTGTRMKPLIYKKYTPEYQAKLDAMRKKRQAKKLAERVAEFNNNLMGLVEKQGFGSNGKIYVVIGNTYDIKEQLKSEGALYREPFKWYFTEPQTKYNTIELDYTECLDIYQDYGTIEWKHLYELKELLKNHQPKEEAESEFVGEVGKRVDLELIFLHRYTYEQRSFRGFGTDTVAINQFKDSNGNILVWKSTSAFFDANEGETFKVRATIKEHSIYKGEKQTLLSRCDVKKQEDGQ